MVRKSAIACSIVLVAAGVTLADKFSSLLGAAICCVLAYWSATKFLKVWLENILCKLERAPVRSIRYHQRNKLFKSRSTWASGLLLPWIEKIIIFKSKSSQKPHAPLKASQTEDELDQEDFSPSADRSSGFCVDIPNFKFCGSNPVETNEIKSFVHHISESYIQLWYKKISDNEDFPRDLDYVLEDIFVNLGSRISKLNINQLFNQIFILSHNHVLTYIENAGGCERTPGKYSRRKENQNGKSHPALRDSKSEGVYLSTICETLVDLVGPQDALLCPLVRTIVSEILTHNLLLPAVNLISDPAFVFWTLVFFLGDSSLLNHITKRNEPNDNVQRDRSSGAAKRKLDLSLPLKDVKRDKRSSSGSQSLTRRGRLTRTKSFSYNNLCELDEPVPKCSGLNKSDDMMHNSLHKMSASNLCSATHLSESSWDLWTSAAADGYFVSRPPFSLFPVPGHSRKAELNSRKSSPSHMFPCLPMKKAKVAGCGMNTSHSFDELLLPPANVFQTQGMPLLTPKTIHPTPSISLDVESAEEATESAVLQQFYNIRILNTEELFDSRSKKYVLYCIQYDYLEPEMTVMRGEGDSVLVPCTAMVRRRFREFLALQNRLEHPKLKKHLKGIKGPSKWLSSTFSATDKQSVDKRRHFLQGYLQKVCGIGALVNSPELHEFLAYKGDARIAFVKKAPELAVPRIDKMVVRGFMGALDLLKTALPSLPPQESPNSAEGPKGGLPSDKGLLSSRSILTGFIRSKSDVRLPSLEYSCRMERISPLSQQIYNFLDSFDTSSSPEDSRPNSPSIFTPFLTGGEGGGPSRGLLSTNVPAWRRAASRLDGLQASPPAGPRPRGDGCDSIDPHKDELDRRAAHMEKIQESFQGEIPLANTAIDTLLCILFPSHALSDDYATMTLKILLGDILQKWLQKHLIRLSSEERCVHYLHSLHEVLWPPSNQQQAGQKIKDQDTCREAAFRALADLFPGKFKFFLGLSDVNCNISIFLDSLQNRLTNRNLIYQVIDVVMDMMCAQDLQQAIL